MVLAIKENETPRSAEVIQLFPKKEKDLTCSETTSRGRGKARAADAIESLDDIKRIQNYFLDKNDIRDYMMFTVGICTGFRISDVCRLRVCDVIKEDGSFRDYIYIVEKKTGKISCNINDKCLITEAMQEAISKYLEWRGEYKLTDPLVYSRKGGVAGHYFDPRSGWRVLAKAGRDLNLPYHLSSHSMRKTFANIAACVGSVADINMPKLLSIQHMLKHGDYKTTMKYLGLTSVFTEQARKNVSDFVMGKTDKNVLTDALFERENDESEKLDLILEAINKIVDLTEG